MAHFEELFNQVQRGLLLLKNHLDLFQKRNSYQLRLLKISNAMHYSATSDNLQSHLKQLEQVNEELRLYSFNNETSGNSSAKSSSNKNVLNIVCNVHALQFKFNLMISGNDCVGDLKAITREILVRVFKSASSNNNSSIGQESQDESDLFTSPLSNTTNDSKYLTLNSVCLTNPLLVKYNQHLFRKAYKQIIALNTTSKELANLIKSINENEDGFYLKITANGQELSTTSNNTSTDSKFIHEFGLKDTQTININLHYTQNAPSGSNSTRLDKECIPMLILAHEPHFSNLFQLVSLTCLFKSRLNSTNELGLRKKCLNLSCKLWKIIVLIPTDKAYLNAIKTSPEVHLIRLINHLSGSEPKQTVLDAGSDLFNVFSPISLDSTPYQLLYYLQIFEIVFRQTQIQQLDQDLNEENIVKGLYKLLNLLVGYLLQKKRTNFDEFITPDDTKSPRNSSLTLEILLECVLIVLRLLCNYLFENKPSRGSNRASNKLKHGLVNESIERVEDEITELAIEDEAGAVGETPPKRQKKAHTSATTNFYNNPQVTPYHASFLAKLVNVPSLRVSVFNSMVEGDFNTFVNLILNIQVLASLTNNSVSFYNNNHSNLTTTSIELLFNSMQLVTSYLFSLNSVASCSLFVVSNDPEANLNVRNLRRNWLKCLLMIEHYKLSAQSEPNDLSVAFRREACAWLYRMCVLSDNNSNNSDENLTEEDNDDKSVIKGTILGEMFDLLTLAVKSKPMNTETKSNLISSSRMRLNCKDFFLLINNLVTKFGAACQSRVPNSLEFVFAELRHRSFYEQPIVTGIHESYQEDDVLVGLLSLAISLVRYFEKTTEQAQVETVIKYIDDLYSYLFDLSTSQDGLYRIQLPKFRSSTTRSLGFDLLLELGKTSCDAYTHLYDKLMWLNRGDRVVSEEGATNRLFNKNLNQIVCDYWPKDDVKSPCGYVGLVNLGATCYMATAMQHLFMINEARHCILSTTSDSLENK